MRLDRHINMRQDPAGARRRKLWLAAAGAAGAVALIVAVGVLIVATFPKPDQLAEPSSLALAASKAAPPKSTVSSPATLASKPSTASASKPPTPTPPPAPKKAAPKPSTPPAPVLPLGMKKTLSGSHQMLIATGSKLGATHGTLRIYNLTGGSWRQVLSAPCRFGTNGLIDGNKRKEGSRTTPTGIWWPGEWVWGWHASPPSGTKMPYKQTTENVWWSCERNSTYNTWVVSSHHVDGEHLVDVRVQYEYALSSGYNASPNQVVRGRGTAIFLHVFDPPDFHNGLSAGCITVSRSDMVRVFRTMDPALKPCFAVGTEKNGTSTSISAY
jgi:L,D-peptidoglycan transpeptidase YkuD (ErfK/YbiS/YcfS/YnhG family)